MRRILSSPVGKKIGLLKCCQCRGLLGTVGTIAKQEGPAALWKGLEAGRDSYVSSETSRAIDMLPM